MKKLTPVIIVEAVEPCIAFWIDRLGFEKTVEVPEGDRVGFAAVSAGNVEVMYQSRASAAKDVPTLADGPFHRSGALFVDVSDLDAIKVKLAGAEVIFPERATYLWRMRNCRACTVWNSGDIRRNDRELIAAERLNPTGGMPLCCAG